MKANCPIPSIEFRRRDLFGGVAAFVGTTMLSKYAVAAPATDEPFDASKIRALAFDIQGTTLDYYTPLADMMKGVNQQKGLALDVDAVITEWRHGYSEVIGEILAGKRAWIPTEQVYADALDRVLDRHNVGDKFSAPDRARMTEVWAQMIPWPDTASGLERLRKKFLLTTLSNSGMQTVGKMLKRLDLQFDYILTAELAHSFKPDGGVYRLVTQNLGVPVENIMMIACHKYDLKGAHEFGFRTGYIPRPRELGPAGKPDTRQDPYIDVMGGDLNDLASKLGA